MSRNNWLRCVALLASVATGVAAAHGDNDDRKWGDHAYSPIVAKVRAATAQFRDVEAAMAAGYVAGPCVSGQNGGAMGIHYANFDLVLDPALDVTQPEILVYEPLPGGRLRLVGVEFLALDDGDPNTGSPVLEGHLLNYAGAPNRYGLPAAHQLHVWAWKRNPSGTFADWNPNVSCDAMRDEGTMAH